MSEILELAVAAARAAGASIEQAAKDLSGLKIEQKSLHDYVSEVDRRSEQIVVETILGGYPEHQILGEEYGQQGSAKSDCQWIIDPLDGTTNFLRSIPHYAVSIALKQSSRITHGVIYDPIKDELFTAEFGKGARLNGKLLEVAKLESARSALLATGVPFSGKNLAKVNEFTDTMAGLLSLQTSGIRRLGSAALDLAYVAAGRYDGYWEANLQPWDIAAGVLMVTEAGGAVTDLHGANEFLQSGDILAANHKVHKEMLAVTSLNYSSLS